MFNFQTIKIKTQIFMLNDFQSPKGIKHMTRGAHKKSQNIILTKQTRLEATLLLVALL